MKLIKPLSILALIYCCLGPLLLIVETKVAHISPTQQAFPITLLAIFFFAYSLLSLYIFNKLIDNHSKSVTHFYLISKTLRFFLCMVLIVIYGVITREGLLAFAINLFVFYMATVIYTTIYCAKAEYKNKKS